MGFTTELNVECTKTQKPHTNPMKIKHINLNKDDFYSFLQDLNYKTEIGIE